MRSALDELRSEDLEMASEEELGEGLVELERASRVLEAERSRRLVDVERRGSGPSMAISRWSRGWLPVSGRGSLVLPSR